jgi:hypothetical protein
LDKIILNPSNELNQEQIISYLMGIAKGENERERKKER